MTAEEYIREIVLDVFIFFLIASTFFFIYRIINKFDLPGIEERLVIFTVISGVLSAYLYREEIEFYFKWRFGKPKVSIGMPKIRLHYQTGGFIYRNSLLGRTIKLISEYLNTKKLIFGLAMVLIVVGLVFFIASFNKIPSNFIILTGILVVSAFLYFLKADPRIFVGLSIFFLILTQLSVFQRYEKFTQVFTNLLYYSLIVSLLLTILNYFTKKKIR